MRVTFVQHGDYREAVRRLTSGGEETYYAQRYSVDFVGAMTRHCEDVSIICVAVEPSEDELPDGTHFIGMDLSVDRNCAGLIQRIEARKPTHLILRTPLVPVLRWAQTAAARTLPLLADSFPRKGLRGWFRNRRLARELNTPRIEWIANHNINSCKDLARIGVEPAKVIPWDWPAMVSPDDFPPKAFPPAQRPIRLLYAGMLIRNKGVGDIIEAVAQLNRGGVPCALTIVGNGDDEPAFRDLVEKKELAQQIRFLGRVAHGEVVRLMREHDLIVVASRHEYSEGLPMTIYEALASRTPLILSDHPMFNGKVAHRETGMVFHAGQPGDLAACVKTLVENPGLYEALSRNSKGAWEALRCPVLWGELLERWLRNTATDREWLAAHALAARSAS